MFQAQPNYYGICWRNHHRRGVVSRNGDSGKKDLGDEVTRVIVKAMQLGEVKGVRSVASLMQILRPSLEATTSTWWLRCFIGQAAKTCRACRMMTAIMTTKLPIPLPHYAGSKRSYYNLQRYRLLTRFVIEWTDYLT